MERNVGLAGEASDLKGGGRVRLTDTQLKILGTIAASRRHPITHEELAESVGCCAKTVDRAIARFRNAGLVEVRNARRADGGRDADAYVLSECAGRESRAG